MKIIINNYSRIWLFFDKQALYYMFDGSCLVLFFFIYYMFLVCLVPKGYKGDIWIFLSALIPFLMGVISIILFQHKKRD